VITVRRCDVRVLLPHPWSPVAPDALPPRVLALVADAVVARLAERLDDSRPVVPRMSLRLVAAPAALAAVMAPEPRRHRTPEGGATLPAGLTMAVREAVDAALYDLYARPVFEPAPAAVAASPGLGGADGSAAVPGAELRAACLRLLRRSRRGRWLTELLRSVNPAVVAEWAVVLGVAVPRPPSASTDPAPQAIGGGSPSAFPLIAPADAAPGAAASPGSPGDFALDAGYPGSAPDAASTGAAGSPTPAAAIAVPDAGPASAEAAVPAADAARPGPSAQDGTASRRPPANPREAAVPATSPDTAGASLRADAPPAAGAGALVQDAVTDPELEAIRAAIAGELRRHDASTVSRPRAAAVTATAPWTGEVHLTTVLPFLLLGPLRRIGALDALAAILAGLGYPEGIAAFAAALARKAVSPPGRGWYHPPEVAATIAAVAARPNPPNGADTERLASAAPEWFPAVRGLVRAELTVGRLVAATGPQGVMLADEDGVFPLGPPADDLGNLPVTEDRGALGDFVAEMAERPASGRGDLSPALDPSLDMLAGFGLADVAWRLWHHREATHPLLALERFADLDGRAEFTADRVIVRIPLGRRHADLLEHGLLDTVPDIPWLGGRPLELSGG
jgi:hypothetical protein